MVSLEFDPEVDQFPLIDSLPIFTLPNSSFLVVNACISVAFDFCQNLKKKLSFVMSNLYF